MGFSLIAAFSITIVSTLICAQVLTGDVWPTITDIRESYEEMRDRAIDQLKTEVNISGIVEESTDGNWWNNNWSHRKLITIDSSITVNTLSNFPVLIYESSDTDLAARAQADGDDIAFVLYSDNTTQLDHEIEVFNISDGELVAWVELTFLNESKHTKIWMYYRNTDCTSQQDPYGTWNSDYIAVWHMNDLTATTIGDSTFHNHNGTKGTETAWGSSPSEGNGLVGYCQQFDGDNINVSNTTGDTSLTRATWNDAITVEAFVKDTSGAFPVGRIVISQGDGDAGGTGRNWINIRITNGRWQTGIGGSAFTTTAVADTNNWEHVVFHSSGSNETPLPMMVRAFRINKTAFTEGIEFGDMNESANGDIVIGAHKSNKPARFIGFIDELRVSKIARNVSWIDATYNTVMNPGTYLTFGNEEDKGQVNVNVTVKNLGRPALKTEDFDLLINGTLYSFTSSSEYLEFEDEVYLTTTSTVPVGSKRVKIITDKGITDYYLYTI